MKLFLFPYYFAICRVCTDLTSLVLIMEYVSSRLISLAGGLSVVLTLGKNQLLASLILSSVFLSSILMISALIFVGFFCFLWVPFALLFLIAAGGS